RYSSARRALRRGSGGRRVVRPTPPGRRRQRDRVGPMVVVQKYGGTSVADGERIRNVAGRIARTRAAGHGVVVVVSAMAGETNRLLALARAIATRPDQRESDALVATGEQVTAALTALALQGAAVSA